MTRQPGRSRSRWTHLALACAGLLFLVAGCLGENVGQADTLQVDRPTDAEEDCPEVEVLRENLHFTGRLLPIGDHGKTWPIELRAGEAVEIWIGHGKRGTSLPDLRMADPAGALLLDKEGYSINGHDVRVEADGTHEITVEHQYLTKTAEWTVEINWYPDTECA